MLPAAKSTQGIICGEHKFSFPAHMNYGIYFIEKILKLKDKRALVNGATDEKLTFGDIIRQVTNVAASLTELGVKRGEVVAVVSENRSEVVTAGIAALCAGAVVTFINSAYSAGELLHVTDISKPKYVFLSPNAYKKQYETLKKLTCVSKLCVFGESPSKEILNYNDLANKQTDYSTFIDYYGKSLFLCPNVNIKLLRIFYSPKFR